MKAFMLSHGININSAALPTPPLSLSPFAYSPLLYPFFLHCLFCLALSNSPDPPPPPPLFLSALCLLFDLPECVFASVC